MPVISVVGAPGVGKSFLVRQLASVTSSPAFFEGEEGTIPPEIWADIVKKGDPVRRWQFFLERYQKNLATARSISDAGFMCFFDGAVISAWATLVAEEKKFHKALSALIRPLERFPSDQVLLLTAREDTLRSFMHARSRSQESDTRLVQRALQIQEEFLALAKKEKNVVVVDRTARDFTKVEHVQEILALLHVA